MSHQRTWTAVMVMTVLASGGPAVGQGLTLDPQQIIQAGGVNIDVGTYSVPSLVRWDADDLHDLLVGQGDGKVRVYLNIGTSDAPSFDVFSYVQDGGSDLSVGSSGCMGSFPRAVDWDRDGRLDLIVGESGSGYVKFFKNTAEGPGDPPQFNGATDLTHGPGTEVIAASSRCTPTIVDWNNDGNHDLITGGLDGCVRYYQNASPSGMPALAQAAPVMVPVAGGGSEPLDVGARSSPAVADMDGDGRKDLVIGQTDGKLRFYSNVGSDDAPAFSNFAYVQYDTGGGVLADIDLPGSARSRPAVCDWNADGNLDLLVGGGDGLVRLYPGTPDPATIILLLAGSLTFLIGRRSARPR